MRAQVMPVGILNVRWKQRTPPRGLTVRKRSFSHSYSYGQSRSWARCRSSKELAHTSSVVHRNPGRTPQVSFGDSCSRPISILIKLAHIDLEG